MTTGENGGEKKRTGRGWGSLVIQVSGQLFFAVVLLGMVLYLLAQYKKDSFQPFELATVVGLLGGFIFVAAFGGKVPEGLRKRLKRIGSLYLLATISLVVFGFYQAADQAKLVPKGWLTTGWMTVFYTLTFYMGTLSFIAAMWLTLRAIPEFLEIGNVGDIWRSIFGGKPKRKK
jgi:peptidoglycan/LPS O-acetylase OafA/YrhL